MPLELTAAGLSTQRLAEILEDLKQAFIDSPVFGKNVKLGPETAEGQLIGIFGEREANLQELLQELWDAWNPDGAMGVLADFLAGLVGVKRKQATYSKVTLQVDVDSGKTLQVGSQCRVPDAGIFAVDEDLAGDGSGTQTVGATATVTGPVEASAASITEIVTDPGGGWNSVTNPAKAIEGRNTETTAELMARREESLQAGGTARTAAIEAHVEKLEDVQACAVIENYGLETDARGIPGKSMRVVIWPTGVDEQAVVNAMWEVMGACTLTDGTQEYEVTDAKGKVHPRRFSYGALSEIYTDIEVIANDNWPSDGIAQIVAALKLWDNDFSLGTKVLPDDMRDFIREQVPGIDNLRIRIKEGSAPSAADIVPLYLDIEKVAYFDSNIAVYLAS